MENSAEIDSRIAQRRNALEIISEQSMEEGGRLGNRMRRNLFSFFPLNLFRRPAHSWITNGENYVKRARARGTKPHG